MANRIRGNVIIIDSGTINLQFPGGGEYAKVSSIVLWGLNTTGLLELSFQANSSDIIVKMQSPINDPNTTQIKFPTNHQFEKIRVNTLTAGTAWMYLS